MINTVGAHLNAFKQPGLDNLEALASQIRNVRAMSIDMEMNVLAAMEALNENKTERGRLDEIGAVIKTMNTEIDAMKQRSRDDRQRVEGQLGETAAMVRSMMIALNEMRDDRLENHPKVVKTTPMRAQESKSDVKVMPIENAEDDIENKEPKEEISNGQQTKGYIMLIGGEKRKKGAGKGGLGDLGSLFGIPEASSTEVTTSSVEEWSI